MQGKKGNCPFGYIFSPQASDLGSSRDNRNNTFLQPEKGVADAR